jgi:periplasmic divalent cation tolerance protein
MLIAWTTVTHRADAETLAATVIAGNHAVCVQVEGPVVSHYRWQGRVERAEEFRLCFKLLPAQLPALEACALRHHPYDTPEWIVVRAEHVGEKYLSWAQGNPHSPPL